MTTKFKQIINPHSHSDYSLDGAATVSQIVKINKELGATHVTLTEHGNMNSAMELYKSAQNEGIKPIIGMEAYLINPWHNEYVELYRKAVNNGVLQIREKTPEAIENAIQKKAMNHYLHITIHFKDAWAYQYFCQLSPKMWSRSIKKYNEEKPLITMEELEGAAGHITIGSSCMKGPVQYFMLPSKDGLIPPQPEKSKYMYEWLKRISGKDSFFVEVFPHEITHEWQKPEKDQNGRIVKEGYFKPHECTCHAPDGDMQKPLNKWVIDLAEKNGDKVIISLDSHYATRSQKVIQDARLGNGDENWRFYNSYHVMPTEEAAIILKRTLGVSDKKIEEWVDNSYFWASNFDSFKLSTSKERWILAGDSDRFMKRLKSTIDKWGRMNWGDSAMVERLKHEIQILANNKKLNLLAYFETIEDIANFCRENGVLMNVRGSAGGSLLLYLVGVSGINPMKHDLSFGRFLTEGRIEANNLPDVDMDVSDQEKVIEYLKYKYGEGICRLSTDLLLRIKSSIKDAERSILGKVRKETEDLCKKLPSTPQGTEDIAFVFGFTDKNTGEHVDGIFDKNIQLQNYAAQNPEIWNVVKEMLGIQRNKSSHACGFIICDRPVTDYMPVIKINGEWVTGFSPKSVEAAGGIKFDLLGLNTLRDIQICLESIKKRTGQTIDPWNLPNDPEVWDIFVKGEVDGVFQFDTPTIRPYVIKTKPRSIDLMAALTALGRPGTLDAPAGDGTSRTLAQLYVDRANGEPVQYLHPELEPILKDTYGIQLFQEQTIKIFTSIGGMTDAEADEVRRGIGKKNRAVLDAAAAQLKESCLKKGWSEEQVMILMRQIEASANYSFNKSHAISYAYVAYACMYLKTKFKLDWWKAILSNATKDELATKFWKNVQDFTTLPDINISTDDYEIINDKIIAPFSILSGGVGEKAYESLMKNKPYKSLEHFISSHFPTKEEEDQKKLNKKEGLDLEKGSRKSAVTAAIARKLIAGGVLDSLFEPGMLIEEKLYQFEQLRGQIKGKKPEKVPDEYIGISTLGKYLLRKQLIQIHSDDLREIMLPVRGGQKLSCRLGDGYESWFSQGGVIVLDGNQIQWFRKIYDAGADVDKVVSYFDSLLQKQQSNQMSVPSQIGHRDRIFQAIGYVISEKAFPYKNKSKQANKMVLDFNGYFTEEMLWPDQDEDQADLGFKGKPVLALFGLNKKGVYLKKVIPLLTEESLEKYNMT